MITNPTAVAALLCLLAGVSPTAIAAATDGVPNERVENVEDAERTRSTGGAGTTERTGLGAASPDALPDRTSERFAAHRRFGFELNPYMLGTTIGGTDRDRQTSSDFETYVTGTLSIALPGDDRREIALPFAVIDYDATGEDPLDEDFSLRRLDVQLRHYQRERRKGLYMGPLLRLSHIEGEALDDADGGIESGDRVAFSRVGAGVVVGLRGLVWVKSLERHLYWGTNLQLGTWLNDAPTSLRYLYGPMEDADRSFANVEFAKIGIRF